MLLYVTTAANRTNHRQPPQPDRSRRRGLAGLDTLVSRELPSASFRRPERGCFGARRRRYRRLRHGRQCKLGEQQRQQQ